MIPNWVGDLLDLLATSQSFRQVGQEVRIEDAARQGSRLAKEIEVLVTASREAERALSESHDHITNLKGSSAMPFVPPAMHALCLSLAAIAAIAPSTSQTLYQSLDGPLYR